MLDLQIAVQISCRSFWLLGSWRDDEVQEFRAFIYSQVLWQALSAAPVVLNWSYYVSLSWCEVMFQIYHLKVNFKCHTPCCAYLTMEKKATEDKKEKTGLTPNKLALCCIISANRALNVKIKKYYPTVSTHLKYCQSELNMSHDKEWWEWFFEETQKETWFPASSSHIMGVLWGMENGTCSDAPKQSRGVSDDVNLPCPIQYSFSKESDSKACSAFIFTPFGSLRPPVVLQQTSCTHLLTAGFRNYSLSLAQTLAQEGHY